MCGRFPQALQAEDYRRSVTPQLPRQRQPRTTRRSDDYHASYNVAPSSVVPVCRCILPEEDLSRLDVEKSTQDDNDQGPTVVMQTMRWGLLPPHQKTPPTPKDTFHTINARDDTMLSGNGLWSRPLKRGQRCVVFVMGFYEWLKQTKGSGVDRIAHFVGLEEEGVGRKDREGKKKKLMPLAGLWEKCHIEGESEPRYTFTIITTEVCKELSFLHDRQPLILPSNEAIATWLDPKAPLNEVEQLVKTFEGGLQYFKVPREVGKVGNDDPGFILPIEDRKDGLMAAFGRAQKATTKKTGEQSPVKIEQSKGDVNSESHAPKPKAEELSDEEAKGPPQKKQKRASEEKEILPKVESLDSDELIAATKEAEKKGEDSSEPSKNEAKELLEVTKAAEKKEEQKSGGRELRSRKPK